MKKIFLFVCLIVLCFQNMSFASETNDEMYYKRQIQNQRYLYSNRGFAGAIKKGDNNTVDNCIKAGFDVNATQAGIPLTFYAVIGKQPEALNLLLKGGANPNAEYMGYSLINYVLISNKNSDLIKVLIDNKADVNLPSKKITPLTYAIKAKQVKIVEMLLKAGANPDDKTKQLVSKSKDEYLKSLFE